MGSGYTTRWENSLYVHHLVSFGSKRVLKERQKQQFCTSTKLHNFSRRLFLYNVYIHNIPVFHTLLPDISKEDTTYRSAAKGKVRHEDQ